jgi:hypothetical protein
VHASFGVFLWFLPLIPTFLIPSLDSYFFDSFLTKFPSVFFLSFRPFFFFPFRMPSFRLSGCRTTGAGCQGGKKARAAGNILTD